MSVKLNPFNVTALGLVIVSVKRLGPPTPTVPGLKLLLMLGAPTPPATPLKTGAAQPALGVLAAVQVIGTGGFVAPVGSTEA